MSATVLSFFRPAPVTTGDWSQQELAEFYRVEAASVQAGLRLSLDRGLSDEGDPWLVFCREDGEVFLHFARIDGAYVICSDMIDRPLTGPDFRALLGELVSQNPSVLPLPREAANGRNGRRGAQILMHPAALLAAIVATACLFSSMNEAVASELDTGPHTGGHSDDAPALDAAAPVEVAHKVSPATSPGFEPRAHDNFDRELALITGVILACIATYAKDQHLETSAAVSPLSIAAEGGLQAGHSVADSAAAVELAGGRQAGIASHSQAANDGFKPLVEAEGSSTAQVTLQDLRSGHLLQSAPLPQVALPSLGEPVLKTAFAGDPAVPVPNGYRLFVGAGPGNGTPRPTDLSSPREHAAVPSEQSLAGGSGSDRGGDVSQATVSVPAVSDSGAGRSPASVSTSAGEVGSPRSTGVTSTDSGATRNVASAVAADTPKVVATAANTVSGDGTKSAAVSVPDATSTSAATLTKTLATTSTLLTFGTSDFSYKSIGAIFSDVSVLSSKTISLLLHALVDIPSDAGSSKTSSDLLSGLGSTSSKLTGTALVGSGTAVTGSSSVSSAVVDASHTVTKVTDGNVSAGTGAVTSALSSVDATKTILSPLTDATKVAVGVGTVPETSKTALVTTSTGDHSTDGATHTSSTSPSTSAADSNTKAIAAGSSTGTGDLLPTKSDSTSVVVTKVVDGIASAAGATIATGTTSVSTTLSEATAKAVTADGSTTAAARTDPTVVHQADATASLEALHAVAALTSSSNTISRAVSVGLGGSAAVLDSVQLRIIDLFLQATPDAKFRAVDNTLEIYDPSASSDVSSHAAVWDIGGGAFVRVIGITDTHIAS